MSQRKAPPPDSRPQTSADSAANPDPSADAAGDGMPNVDAPQLVPAQDETSDITPREAWARRRQREQTRALSADIVTVSFEDAAREAGHGHSAGDGEPQPAAAAYLRAKRFIPLAAAIAIAAAIGALTGALATAGLSRLTDDQAASAAIHDGSRALNAAMAKIGSELATLKANVDTSSKSTSTQLARLGDRLERTDRAQAEASSKVAKLADTLERRSAAAAADPLTTGSIAAVAVPPVPALPPAPTSRVVEGWTLHSVQNGTALIRGRIGLVEVEPGDSLPDLGRIETIRRQDGRWVVVTSRGLIVSR